MDEVQIYHRAVSPLEIAQILSNNTSSISDRVGNWKLDESSGSTASDTVGLTCSGSCSETYASGTLVNLNANPAVGSVFAGWSGDADCNDGSVTMDADKACTATFNPGTYLLTANKSGTGSGTVTSSPAGINCGTSCSAAISGGSTVLLFQAPDSSSGFSGWGGACSGTGDCAFSMSSDRSVSADFTLSPLVKNLRTGVAYSLLQIACSEASYGDTIRALSTLPAAGLLLDKEISLTIEGGYDAAYSSCIGLTPVLGRVNIKLAPLRVNRLVIRPAQP